MALCHTYIIICHVDKQEEALYSKSEKRENSNTYTDGMEKPCASPKDETTESVSQV